MKVSRENLLRFFFCSSQEWICCLPACDGKAIGEMLSMETLIKIWIVQKYTTKMGFSFTINESTIWIKLDSEK